MGLLERLDPDARTALLRAEDVAKLAGRTTIDCVHLTLGALSGEFDSVRELLAPTGVSVEEWYWRIRSTIETVPEEAGALPTLPYTECGHAVLTQAVKVADASSRLRIGPEDFLLAALAGCQALRSAAATLVERIDRGRA